MDNELCCWKCGAPLRNEPLPLGRLAECRACRADLHVCRQCVFFDTRLARQCRETVAEEVKDKERANFCDYFEPSTAAYTKAADGEVNRARAELEALFGDTDSGGKKNRDPADPEDLFK